MKELLQQKALDYLAGAKEILDNPELYGLVKKEFFDEAVRKNESLRSSLSASERFRMQDAAEHLDDNLLLRKENKELKEKVTELEGVIAKLSQKVILYESNY
jgi:polyhydroxyalkanoate synthesis regulator phasin